MNRKESSRLGDLQAEGNLGNERNRNSDSSNRERMRNRSSEPRRDRDRMSDEIGEEWSPSGMHDNNDVRRGDDE